MACTKLAAPLAWLLRISLEASRTLTSFRARCSCSQRASAADASWTSASTAEVGDKPDSERAMP
eukprot:6205349-Pleurochrysis_carterae.AAC.7